MDREVWGPVFHWSTHLWYAPLRLVSMPWMSALLILCLKNHAKISFLLGWAPWLSLLPSPPPPFFWLINLFLIIIYKTHKGKLRQKNLLSHFGSLFDLAAGKLHGVTQANGPLTTAPTMPWIKGHALWIKIMIVIKSAQHGWRGKHFSCLYYLAFIRWFSLSSQGKQTLQGLLSSPQG